MYLKPFLTITLFSLCGLSFAQEKVNKEQYNEALVIFAEAKVSAINLMNKLGKNSECYFAPLQLNGTQSIQSDNFQFKETSFAFKTVICFDNQQAILSSNDSIFKRIGNNTFISFIQNTPNQVENIETIQLDFSSNKMKYTKNIVINPTSAYSEINGVSAFIGDIVKLTK